MPTPAARPLAHHLRPRLCWRKYPPSSTKHSRTRAKRPGNSPRMFLGPPVLLRQHSPAAGRTVARQNISCVAGVETFSGYLPLPLATPPRQEAHARKHALCLAGPSPPRRRWSADPVAPAAAPTALRKASAFVPRLIYPATPLLPMTWPERSLLAPALHGLGRRSRS